MLPLHHPRSVSDDSGRPAVVYRGAIGSAAIPSGTVQPRHGLPDQEAPQAHAEEEAQEAAEEDPLATSSAGQVGQRPPTAEEAVVSRPARSSGRLTSCSVAPSRTSVPAAAADASARRVVASAASANHAAYAEPLPQSSAGTLQRVLRVRAGTAREPRLDVLGRGFQVVDEAAPGTRMARRSARTRRTAEFVPRAVHGRGRAAEGGARRSPGQGRAPRPARGSRRVRASRPARLQQNGTSDPSAAACSDDPPNARARPRRIGRTAAEPGPGRDALVEVDATSCARAAAGACMTRLVSSVGTPAANGPVTCERASRRRRSNASSSCGSRRPRR